MARRLASRIRVASGWHSDLRADCFWFRLKGSGLWASGKGVAVWDFLREDLDPWRAVSDREKWWGIDVLGLGVMGSRVKGAAAGRREAGCAHVQGVRFSVGGDI